MELVDTGTCHSLHRIKRSGSCLKTARRLAPLWILLNIGVPIAPRTTAGAGLMAVHGAVTVMAS
jgi:hypothetical protein